MGEENQSVSIIVIDDNAHNLEFVAEALASAGVRILTSTEPEKGLALIAKHHPRVVLTDVIMPSMSGLDVLASVKQFDSSIDVVLMSTDDLPQNAEAQTAQASSYLRKPISPSQLRRCVANLLQEREPSKRPV